MERKYLIALVAVVAVFAVAMSVRSANNPYQDRRDVLLSNLAQITPVEVRMAGTQSDFVRWKETIESKPSVWRELVAAPPPPKPPPPKPPNTREMIANLEVTRQGSGDIVRIITQDNPRGLFLGPGDSINGMKIKEVTRTTVVFTLDWQGQELREVVQRR